MATVVAWVGAQALSLYVVTGHSFRRSPEGIADRTRDLLAATGHRREPIDRAWGYDSDGELLQRLRGNPPPGLIAAAKAGRAPGMRFWYRESPELLVPSAGRVGPDDPATRLPASALVQTTTEGRLLSLRVVPHPREAGPTPELDWRPLLLAAELDPIRLVPTKSIWTPPDFADTRTAWVGSPPEAPAVRLRAEGAAFEGVPVYFRVAPEDEGEKELRGGAARSDVFQLFLALLFGSLLAVALRLARRNLTSGRGDRVGAKRVAVALFVVVLANWISSASHLAALSEIALLFHGVAWSILASAIAWVLYVALEPMLRRQSPAKLVAWTRLLAGGFRDALVGRDLLLGSAAGALLAIVLRLGALVNVSSDPMGIGSLYGPRGVFSAAALAAAISSFQAMGFAVLLQLLTRGLGSPARGAGALWALFALGLSVRDGLSPLVPLDLLMAACAVFVISRLGLLASFTMLWVSHLAMFYPITLDPSAWFFGDSTAALVLGMIPAAYGAWVVVGRRPAGAFVG